MTPLGIALLMTPMPGIIHGEKKTHSFWNPCHASPILRGLTNHSKYLVYNPYFCWAIWQGSHVFLRGQQGSPSWEPILRGDELGSWDVSNAVALSRVEQVKGCWWTSHGVRHLGVVFRWGCLKGIYIYMGVSKNRGTSKWIVYNGKPY